MPGADVIANDRSRALKHAKEKLAAGVEPRICYPPREPARDRHYHFAMGALTGIALGLCLAASAVWVFLQ